MSAEPIARIVLNSTSHVEGRFKAMFDLMSDDGHLETVAGHPDTFPIPASTPRPNVKKVASTPLCRSSGSWISMSTSTTADDDRVAIEFRTRGGPTRADLREREAVPPTACKNGRS